jgi:tripeptide aminopeptidase
MSGDLEETLGGVAAGASSEQRDARGDADGAAPYTSAPYTSPLARELADDTLARFLRYVRIDTQSRRERSSCPSTPGQLELGALLVSELRELGLSDAEQDANGYVFATLPATAGSAQPVIGLLAHLDTSPDAPGAGVEPLVHRAYAGGAIELPRGGTRLDPETMPELRGRLGHDIVTSSGDTLLGADDKAGIAAIMGALRHLASHPELPRPVLRVGFTPDEEIGEGATLFDLERFGARCAYTIDGSALGELQDETFSALEAILTVIGVDVHPGQARGKLVNALRLAGRILAELPPELSPERTAGREGFIHPYAISGGAGRAELRLILRDFDDRRLEQHRALLEQIARRVLAGEPRAGLKLDVREQYRNMRQHLERVPEVIAAAERAIRAEGIELRRTPIRGGTDGSRLSAMGLPTPNLFNGGHEYHSPREWISAQDLAAAGAVIVRLAGEWACAAAASGQREAA